MLWSSLLLFAALDLFEAGQQGYSTYRIPGLVTLGDGTLLAYAEARKDGPGDWADIDLVLRRSTDSGRTWQPPRILVDAETNTVNNVVAIPGRGRREVHLIYCVNYSRAYYRFSRDSGLTFSPAVDITAAFETLRPQYDWNVIATGPGHGIRLRSGRLLVPIWLSTGGRSHRPSVISTLYSDDHGRTWRTGDIIQHPDLRNPSESMAVQLPDGRVQLNIRSESDALRRAIAHSPDGVNQWSTPTFHPTLREPVCMASLLIHPRGPLFFTNPDHLDANASSKAGRNSQRRNLTLQRSTDLGQTWQVLQVIDPEVSAYSDMTLTRQGDLLVLYEKGGLNGNQYFTQSLRLARIPAQLLVP